MRVVLDTNVLVSAALFRHSLPGSTFDIALEKGRVLVSDATLAEVDDVLRRPKFQKYIDEEQRIEFMLSLIRDSERIDIDCIVDDCRDPRDNKFLELAVSGSASQIVSGDQDLLVLNPFRGIAILTPAEFVQVHGSLN